MRIENLIASDLVPEKQEQFAKLEPLSTIVAKKRGYIDFCLSKLFKYKNWIKSVNNVKIRLEGKFLIKIEEKKKFEHMLLKKKAKVLHFAPEISIEKKIYTFWQ